MRAVAQLLLPFSWMYGAAVWLRNLCYEQGLFEVFRVSVPVIAVGNITAGGTGKTPTTEYLIRYFLGKGKKIAVISRGYKRTSRGTVVVSDGKLLLTDVETSGDEPYQMGRKFPEAVVIVDAERKRAARMAIERYGIDVIVLDDAFQHRALHRDLNIVVAKGKHSLKREPMLPAGTRREQLSSLARADMIVFSGPRDPSNGTDAVPNTGSIPLLAMELKPRHLLRLSDQQIVSPVSVRGVACLGVCGIGNPESFRVSLSDIGVQVKGFLAFRDHHAYRVRDLKKIRELFDRTTAECILTTEKDALRLLSNQEKDILPLEKMYALIVQAEFTTGETLLHEALTGLFKSHAQ